jgi:hypothetical protein
MGLDHRAWPHLCPAHSHRPLGHQRRVARVIAP